MPRFHRVERLSSWRRLALHAWAPPSDPTVYGAVDIDATEALGWLPELRERTGVKVTLTHLVGRAVALAIRERPEVNCVARFGSLYQRESIDVFFQVAFEGGENLAGHKVARADAKSVVEIARELSAGARDVRAGSAENVRTTRRFARVPPALTGYLVRASQFLTNDLDLDLSRFGVPYDAFGSAMVTNVGSFGLSAGFAPLVPMARCALLILVGEVQPRPVVRDGAVVVRPILPLGVTFDHRILDGHGASVLARRFRAVMEAPRTALADDAPG